MAAGCGSKADKTGTGGSAYRDGINYDVAVVKPLGGLVSGLVDAANAATTSSQWINSEIQCGFLVAEEFSKCDAKVRDGGTVQLQAQALPGYQFRQWAGDCSGTAATCNVGPRAANDFVRIVAVFDPVEGGGEGGGDVAVTSRLYGYARNGATAIGGVTIALFDPAADPSTATPVVSAATGTTKNADGSPATSFGSFVLSVAPGTYSVQTYKANSSGVRVGYGTPFTFTVPGQECGIEAVASSGLVPAYSTQPSFASGGEAANGCLVKMDLATTATNSAAPAVAVDAGAAGYLAGFGQDVALNCIASPDPAVNTTRTISWAVTAGPVTLPNIPAGPTATVTTPTIAQIATATNAAKDGSTLCPRGPGAGRPGWTSGTNAKVGCGVSNFFFRGRPELVTIGRQQMNELAYTFTCTVRDQPLTGSARTYTATRTVQLATFVNANEGNHVAVDEVTGAASVFAARAQVPTGVIVIADDAPRATYDWALFNDSLATTEVAGVTVMDGDTANPWFVTTTTANVRSWLQNRASPETFARGRYAAALEIRTQSWRGNSENCYDCHSPDSANNSGGMAIEQFPEWQNSKHNHIVVDGMAGDHYTTSCLACHTLGFNAGVNNGGWDDVAAAQAYEMPVFTFEGLSPDLAFATMNAEVKKLSNIQCSSCHGPAGGTHINGVGSGGYTAHTASFNSRVCSVCHDGGHHGIYSQWSSTGHANLQLAQDEGSCGLACHTGQGASMYLKARAANGSAAPVSPTLTGLTSDNVEPISCAACHEPHSLELRVTKAAAVNGYRLGASSGAPSGSLLSMDATYGNGVLCATCHNSRRNVGEQMDPAVVSSVGTNATHGGPQADVYMGKSMFFFDPSKKPAVNVHNSEWFKDSCVDCHVTLVPADYATVANHEFNAADSCATCHGGGKLPDGTPSKGKAFMDGTLQQLTAIEEQAAAAFEAFAATTTLLVLNNADAGTSVMAPSACSDTTCAIAIDPGQITKVVLADVHGQLAVKIWLAGNPTQLPDLAAQLRYVWDNNGRVFAADAATVGRNSWFLKAAWNYFLVEADGSLGIHNMYVVRELLAQTLLALQWDGLE